MNIIKIGAKYINLDQVTIITIKTNEITVRGSDGFCFDVTARPMDIKKLQEVLDNMSKKTKEDWEE